MTVKTGAVLLLGLFAGMTLSSSLLTVAHARLVTSLQVNQCAKASRQ
jgi:hypothetical protein